MPVIGEFILPEDPRWKRYLDVNWHDFYHRPEYALLCARNEGGTAAAFYGQGRGASFLAPLVIRQIPHPLNQDLYDCSSPYGYSTPLVGPTQEQLPAFLDAFLKCAKDHRIVTAFFRLHPFLELNKEDLGRFGQIVHHGQTVYIDLSLSDEVFWSQVRRNHRQNIHKLSQLGFEVRLDDWSLLREFAPMYRETMSRVGAHTCLYSEPYFEELKVMLGESMHLCCVLSSDGQVVAGGIFVETAGIVHYHLSATATEFLRFGPNKLIVTFVRAWAQQRYNKVLHLGGGVAGQYDSLFHFKAGFSEARANFYTYRMIVDQHQYETLSRSVDGHAGVRASTPSVYFPAYRRPPAQGILSGLQHLPEKQEAQAGVSHLP